MLILTIGDIHGWLACLDVISSRVWQANQNANLRMAGIDQFASDQPPNLSHR